MLLETIQHLSEQLTKQVRPPEAESKAAKAAIAPWVEIADALKQGPSLPKIELMKFGGDPSEFAEFSVNFRNHIESQVTDDSQRLTRLLAQCVGKARDAIRSCANLLVGQRYSEAWETLLKNFGQPGDATSLMDFTRKLEDVKRVLTSMGPRYVARLDNEDTILMLMKKLPDESFKRKWTDIAGDLICSKKEVSFAGFLNFTRKRAERLNNHFGQELMSSSTQTKEKRPLNKEKQEPPSKVSTLATKGEESPEPTDVRSATLKCYHCSKPHVIWQCDTFGTAPYKERLQTVQQKKLCGSCLRQGHFSRSCPKEFSCRVPGCEKKHHFLLHPPESLKTTEPVAKQIERDQQPVMESQSSAGGTAPAPTVTSPVAESSTLATSRDSGLVEATINSQPRVCFKVVPVKVSGLGGSKQLTTYAFLDSGSDTTLCLKTLVEELDIESEPTEFTLSTVNHEGRECGHRARLIIESLDSEAKFTLDRVLTTDSLPIGEIHFAKNRELNKWPHLDGVSFPEIDERKVSILIGSNRPDIIDINSRLRKEL